MCVCVCVTDQENAEEAASQVQSVSQGVASFPPLSFHNFCPPPSLPPFNPTVGDDVTAVMLLLGGIAGRWKMIASGLGFDEDLIDEIYTNNETDEACLQDCVEKWVSRLGPSWERLSLVLGYLGEERLAQQALEKAQKGY